MICLDASASKLFSVAIPLLLLAACAGAGHRPLIDTKDQDMSNYETDLRECQAIASGEGIGDDVAKSTAVGAATGTAIGVLIGAMGGGPAAGILVGAGTLAGYGAAAGVVDGAVTGSNEQEEIVANCLRGRGYKVLK
jgi:hypothetical protein